MIDVAQTVEDLLEELVRIQKAVNKLKTKSVSGGPLRKQIKKMYKQWLPVCGVLENVDVVDASELDMVSEAWKRLVKLSDGLNLKSQYKPVIRSIITMTEDSLLHSFIKGSAIQTIGGTLRKLVQPISDPELLKYLNESIQCAETNCVRASVVLAWCAVAFKVHEKLVSLGLPRLEGELDKMRQDQGMMFKHFTKLYKISTKPDVQEIPDAHLILLCRFLTYLDDTQYKHLKAALDLRNGLRAPDGLSAGSGEAAGVLCRHHTVGATQHEFCLKCLPDWLTRRIAEIARRKGRLGWAPSAQSASVDPASHFRSGCLHLDFV